MHCARANVEADVRLLPGGDKLPRAGHGQIRNVAVEALEELLALLAADALHHHGAAWRQSQIGSKFCDRRTERIDDVLAPGVDGQAARHLPTEPNHALQLQCGHGMLQNGSPSGANFAYFSAGAHKPMDLPLIGLGTFNDWVRVAPMRCVCANAAAEGCRGGGASSQDGHPGRPHSTHPSALRLRANLPQ